MRNLIHHGAFRISRGSLQRVVELFQTLGFREFERSVRDGEAAAYLGQSKVLFCIQVNEADAQDITFKQKLYSHIAFVSDDPRADRDALVSWCTTNDTKTTVGEWSDHELWIDCPDLFVDFVIEFLHSSMLGKEYDMYEALPAVY